MKIEFVEIQNFRKLKKCKIELSAKETVFVGANNSGKTTAMHALIKFLKKDKFSTRDFTLTNWLVLNEIGKSWIKEDVDNLDLSLDKWVEYLPTLDIWLNVEENEIHYVNHLIPTLDWNGGSLGVRLRFEPKNIEDLYQKFHSTYENSKLIKDAEKIKLWPNDLWDFLGKKGNLNELFSIKTYLLDPTLKTSFQKLPENSLSLDSEVFNGLVKVDIIEAQRGFHGVNPGGNKTSDKNLSDQLRSYYDKHLNPSERPTGEDVEALKAIQLAKELFDQNLKDNFSSSLGELEKLNYPGFGNPTISLSSKFETADTLNHDSSVQYNLSGENKELSLSEKYNGLGYQNLISMVFKLIRFRDEWMQIGKSYTNEIGKYAEKEFEPLHLVLVEEPEAHLHAQVQQVFIKKAYDVLRNNENLEGDKFTTQLVISTHSNHIAHEIDFISLRYFKRVIADQKGIDTSTVVNLSEIFGKKDETIKFATRYLKTTHCDLFFADAVIIVEGTVERMLLPYFIKSNGKDLASCYISILEIGGSHAHTLRPLIEVLGIICLIITDLDSKDSSGKVQPEKGKNYKTRNNTLKEWIPSKENLDDLFKLKEEDKIDSRLPIRVAFQIPLQINRGEEKTEVFPYTFEDSLVMENKNIFKELGTTRGLLKDMVDAAKREDIKSSAKDMYEAINKTGAKKAEFALDLLYLKEPNELKTPKYIKEGLDWLRKKLSKRKDGFNDIKK